MNRTLAVLAAPLALAVLLAPGAVTAHETQSAGKMPHLRAYLGVATASQVANGSGGAVMVGLQGYGDILPVLHTYWGTELVGVKLGSLILPIVGGDAGIRFTPFPDWLVRPYARASVGLSFLLVVPVPTACGAIGVSLPIFNLIFLDVAFGVRRVFNILNTSESVDLGQMELSLGF